jgi:spore photoproduct lyase
LTKSALVSNALKLQPTPQVVFSWSVNAEYVARRWELGAPSPRGRFAAAKRMRDAGWPVRIRLDPLVPYDDGDEKWRDGYGEAIDHINELQPEMVTIGALRASNKGALQAAAEKNGRPGDLFDYLSEKDPSGFKNRLPFAQQVELFRFALERLDRRRIVPALCKEDVAVWEAVGLKFDGCHCLPAGPTVAEELVTSRGFKRVLPPATAG